MLSNHELKKNARTQLGGKIFANYWLYMVLCCLVLAAMQSLGSLMCGIVYFIITGPLQVGFARILLNRARNKGNVEIGHLFGNFSENFSDCCILGIMITLFTFLWSLLLIVPGIIRSYAYSMAYFIQQENPQKGWQDCIEDSMDMMKGHKGQLFFFYLSFIGWMLLGTLCCVVGIFFVIPYWQMARANFYLSLKESQKPPKFTPLTDDAENTENAQNATDSTSDSSDSSGGDSDKTEYL